MATKTTPKKKTVAASKTTVSKEKTVSPKKENVTIVPTTTQQRSVKVKKTYVIGILLILVVGALLYAGRGLFVAAVVNGQPISRLEIVQQAEKQSGGQALETKIQQALIEQEAQKQNITVSDEEVSAEIKKIEDSLKKQGQNIDEALQSQGMTREDLQRIIRIDKMVGKLVGKDIKVTDEEINEYIEQNKAMLPQGQKEEDLRKNVAESLKQQKLSEKAQTWLADIQKKANILYFVNY